MDSALLTVPDREGFQIELGEALNDYITANYGQTSAPYMQDCQEVNKMRRAVIDALGCPGLNTDPLLSYVGQSLQLCAKFPDDLCCFQWKASLGYSANVVKNNKLWFDAVNVQYNVAARFSQAAQASQDYKLAYHNYQFAAGAFSQAAEIVTSLGSNLPRDLDEPTIHALKILCLAQAQECLWAKQRDEGKIGNLLLAKLASGAAQEYKKCASAAAKSSTIKAEWIDNIKAKVVLFEGISQYRAASHCLERSQYGEQVARLQQANQVLSIPLGNYLEAQLRHQISSLRDRVASDLNNAEKENDLIYMQAVPSRADLPESKVLASMQIKEYPPAKSLFALLLPFAVYKTPAAFSQRLNKYVQTFLIDELDEMNTIAARTFADLGLPAALDIASHPTMVPHGLLRESNAIVEAGGIDYIQAYLAENLKLAADAKRRLEALSPNEQVLNLKAYVETATRSDVLIQEKINNCRYLVEVLANGHGAIETFLPAGNQKQADADLKAKAEAAQLVVDQLETLQGKRQNLIAQYHLRLKTIDFSTPTNEFIEQSKEPITEPAQLEPVYNSIVSKFDPDLRDIDYMKSQQKHLLATLRERVTTFNARKHATQSTGAERDNQIGVLQAACHEFWNIKANLKEGRDFYNALSGKISDLEAQPAPAQWTPDMPINFG